ncbi:MAG: TolC family protein [Elusimicrobiota bacterium]|jgi:outer membrane protein TolC|nr:TolC family protein [Elusimicrobiota bacterium]
MKRIKFLGGAGLILFCAAFVFGEVITIEQYMEIVEKNNPQMHAISAQIEATKNQLAQTERGITPFALTAGGNYTQDSFSGLSQGYDKINTTGYNLGITKQFITGTNISVGGSGSEASYNSNAADPNRNVNTLAPFVSVQQSLWKDFIWGYSYYSIEAAKSSIKATLYNLEYQKQQFIVSARAAYWNLSYAKANTEYKLASYDRYQQLLTWNEKRYKLDLGDRADLLQAQATQKTGELALRVAESSQRQAQTTFNQFINADENSSQYDVVDFEESATQYINMKTIEKKRTRADVLAAMENAKAAEYNQKANINNSGIDVVLNGKYTANGSGEYFSDAQKVDKPVYVVGAVLTVPLDFSRWSKINESYKQTAIAAKKSAEQAISQEKTDWANLVDSWQTDMLNYELSDAAKNYQQQYVDENRRLLERGRTTTNILIQSEESLDISILLVLSAVYNVIMDYEKANILYNNQQGMEEVK